MQFPLEYNDQQVTGGHPSYFSKILHHVLFGFDKRVVDYLMLKGVDPDIVKLSDWKFMERVLFINVSTLVTLSLKTYEIIKPLSF